MQDESLAHRIHENTDRMCELIATSFDGSRAGSRLAAARSRSNRGASRPNSAMSLSSSPHRLQMGRAAFRPGSSLSGSSHASPIQPLAHSLEHETHEPSSVFQIKNLSTYAQSYSLRATKWAAPPRDHLKANTFGRSKRLGSTSPVRPESKENENDDAMSACSNHSEYFDGLPRRRIDFLLRQLRLLCYRKVQGNGSDVSVREIFRHFDSNKDEDEDGSGIDVEEFTSALQKLMLGTAEDGLVSPEEAACMFKVIDTDNGGTICYREVAQLLSQPGWDDRLVARKSNVML